MSVVYIFTDFKDILFDYCNNNPESYVQSPIVMAILLGLAYTSLGSCVQNNIDLMFAGREIYL